MGLRPISNILSFSVSTRSDPVLECKAFLTLPAISSRALCI
jgi:hypothetical protein